MKSIKYLLIAIITLMVYESNFPKSFIELKKEDWIFLILFSINIFYGIYLKINSKN